MLRPLSRSVRRAAFAAVLALVASSAAGCASKPTMKLDHAEVTGVRITFPPSLGILMTVVVDVYNPNVYDVAVRAVRGELVLGYRYSIPIDFRADGAGVWLPTDATTPLRVPVVVPAQLALALLRDAYTAPTIPYRFRGRADVTATRTFKLEKDDYSVDEIGQVSRQQIKAAIERSL